MLKKPLDEKIKIVAYWTFAGVFWYLVVSFFLVSDYPIQNYNFNHKQAYEIIKDALTLAATFLAPVAAFVLFSDWRESHRLIQNEAEVLDILKKSKNIAYEVKYLVEEITGYYHTGYTPDKVESLQQVVIKSLSEIASAVGRNNFSKGNFVNKEFHEACNKIHSEQYDLMTNMLMLFDSYTFLESIKKDSSQHSLLPGLIYQESRASQKYYDSAASYISDFEINLKALDMLAEAHRIK